MNVNLNPVKLPVPSNRNKMINKIIASISSAMRYAGYNRESYSEYADKITLRLQMHKLMGLKTFLLCLKKLGANDTSFTYPAMEEPEESDQEEEEEEEEEDDSTKASQPLEYLLKRLECYLENIDTSEYDEHLSGIESFEDEIDEWYTSLCNYLPQASSSPVAIEVREIFDSVLRNIEDFLSLHIAYVGEFIAPVEALKVHIIFWRNFLRFATFLGIDLQTEFQDLLLNIEALAFSAAHLTRHLFSAGLYNVNVFSEAEINLRASHHNHGNVYADPDEPPSPLSCLISHDDVRSTVSALLFSINPLDNTHLLESYSRSLEIMKCSRESFVLNLDIEGCTDLLLSVLWEALQFHTGPVVDLKDKLQEMYAGLRYLRALLKKHPDKFDGQVGVITRAGIFDVGIMIQSVYQNHDSIARGFEEFRGTIDVIQAEVEEQVMSRSSKINFPKTTVLAFLDFLLNYLIEVKSSTPNRVESLKEHLLFLRSFMEKLVKNQLEDFHESVWNSGVKVAYKIEDLMDQMLLGDIVDSDLDSITEAMQILKTDSAKIFDDCREEIEVPRETNTDQVTSESSILSADDFVGFEDERKAIINRLTRGSKKLQVVAIVGMPGLGKTTLATKVYNESSVQQHFHVRAWCSFSQEFNRRKVFLELLHQIQVLKSNQPAKDYSRMSEEDLAQELRRSLLQRRYLIYIDDVWETNAFDCLKLSFPGDSFGRILLTSRIGDVAKLDDQPHFLRQLTFSESLKLLQIKAFPGKGWPQSLHETAVKIAENCKGLPLIIIIVAGLLGTTKEEVWEEVLVSLTSGVISSTDQCKKAIELSYKHLPEHLKPCFLSFGGFPEDEEISVKRLIWLWIAEGFVPKSDSSCLEEVATEYLKNLIGRSLVMDGQKRNGGGIKTCRIHDLLLDFCVRKAIEENALHLLKGKEEVSHFEESRYLRRLCVHSKMWDFIDSKLSYPHLHSLSFFGEKKCGEVADISFIFRVFKSLRVLSMETLIVSSFDFPGEIGLLARLRYLAVTVYSDISPSIGNLSNLETFIIDPVYETLVTMPDTFWNLQKMRHLYLLNMGDQDEFHGIILPVDNVDSSCNNMLELDTLSGLHSEHWDVMEKKLRKFPNIRRLKFWLYEFGNDCKIMSFSFLSRLESLTLSFYDNSADFELIFPISIKQLNLSRCGLPWERISSIAELPNLEVLKLLEDCFVGGRWQVEEGEFSRLRFLKLGYLDITNWTGCDDQFPSLEKLVVEGCDELEEIPECLESVDTLEMIEVIHCPGRVECLFEVLADYLKDMGNSVLQFRASSSKEKAGSAEEEDDDSANEEDT